MQSLFNDTFRSLLQVRFGAHLYQAMSKNAYASQKQGESAADKRSLTYQEAANRLGISAITLRRWRAEGRIKVRSFSSNLIRVPLEEVERLENEALVSGEAAR